MKSTRKKFLAAAVAALIAVVALAAFAPIAHGDDAKKMGRIRHVVLFDLKDSVTPEQLKTLKEASAKLKGDVETVQTLELGENLAANTRNEGYTLCLFVTFKDEAGLKTYITHPGHEAYKKVLLPLLDKVLVFDYAAES